MHIAKRLLLVLSVCLASHGAAQAQAVTELTMLTWGGAFLDAFKIAGEEFQKQTGIKVSFVTQIGAADGLNKLTAQKDAPQVDVWATIESAGQTAATLGLLAPLDPSKVSNLQDIPKDFIKPTSVALWLSPRGIFYRKDLVPFEIKAWKDLWDPRLKGMVGTSINLDTANVLIMAALLNGGSETNIEPGFAMLKTLKPNIAVVYRTEVEAIKLIQTGEISVCGWCTFANTNRMLGPDSKYVYVIPEGPKFLPTTPVTIVGGRSAAQTDAAQKFVNLLLSPEMQVKMVAIVGNVPGNSKAAWPEAAHKYLPPNITDQPYTIDWTSVMRDYQGWTTRWDRELL